MSVLDNVKSMGGHIIGVLRRLTSYDDTEVVDSTTSLNDALLAAVKDGSLTKKEALEIAKEYVDSDKDGKQFSKKQMAGVKADSKGGFGIGDDEETRDESMNEKVKPSSDVEREIDDR